MNDKVEIKKMKLPETYYNGRSKKDENGNRVNRDNNINYYINTEDYYIVHKTLHNGKPIYMIPVRKKYLNTYKYGYKPIRFKRGVELDDKSVIRIVKGFEDFDIIDGFRTDGERKYTTSVIMITEFELYETPDLLQRKALKDYELKKQNRFEIHK